MTHGIADLYKKQLASKSTANLEDVESLKIGTQVLVYHEQPLGECAKFFQHWKGIYLIKRQIDVYTYIVSPVDAPRKELIVHRQRLRSLESGSVKEPIASKEISRVSDINSRSLVGAEPRDCQLSPSLPKAGSENSTFRLANDISHKGGTGKNLSIMPYPVKIRFVDPVEP